MASPILVTDKIPDFLFAQTERSKGRHVSHAIRKAMQVLQPDKYKDTPIDLVRATLGNALEHAVIEELARGNPDKYARPGEISYLREGLPEKKRIFGTPDLWDLREWATVELKLTWASSRRADEDGPEDEWFWKYWTQLMSYCFMADMTVGYLIVMFVNGNYSKNWDDPLCAPQFRMWRNEWDREELEDNWRNVIEPRA